MRQKNNSSYTICFNFVDNSREIDEHFIQK